MDVTESVPRPPMRSTAVELAAMVIVLDAVVLTLWGSSIASSRARLVLVVNVLNVAPNVIAVATEVVVVMLATWRLQLTHTQS